MELITRTTHLISGKELDVMYDRDKDYYLILEDDEIASAPIKTSDEAFTALGVLLVGD
jgi:non-homologous end joining protein Ku